MKNNFWEEQQLPSIGHYHQHAMMDFGMPAWLKIDCPFCKAKLPLKAIRFIGVRFNTRNMGDMVIEFACDLCGQMDTLYYRHAVENMQDFCDLMKGDKIPQDQPVTEEEMYKKQYNNVAEKMIEGINNINCEI
jgi:hypothetical protein